MKDDLTKTYHGAELYSDFLEAGGTKEEWVSRIAPILKMAGPGPLYRATPEFHAHLMAMAGKGRVK